MTVDLKKSTKITALFKPLSTMTDFRRSFERELNVHSVILFERTKIDTKIGSTIYFMSKDNLHLKSVVKNHFLTV